MLSAGKTKEEAIQDIAINRSAPVGVIANLCEQASPSNGTPETAYQPDWSWQAEAVEKTIESLSQHKGSKIGLIIPTGGGKTFIATQVLLRKLQSDPEARCLWVAHRSFLNKTGAKDVLEYAQIPSDTKQQNDVNFQNRITFSMLENAMNNVDEYSNTHDILVIDEAHRAAASSYRPLIQSTRFTGLLLTATPNRNDGRPIGLDHIAFQTKPKELFRRRCIIEPSIETFEPFPDYNLFEDDLSRSSSQTH